MKKLSSIIFDCDGVLIDSEIIANRIEVEMKKEHGIHISLEEQLQKFVGLNFNDPVMQEELRKLPPDYKQKVHERMRLAYHTELKSIDGVIETLEQISIPMAVASNSEADSLAFKLRLTGLMPFFESAHFSAEAVARAKPAPDLYLHVLNKMNFVPEKCLVIEDSVAGIQAARAAGLKAYGFVGGGHMYPGHDEKLIKAGAIALIWDFRQVLDLI